MKMSLRAVESIAKQLGKQELSVHVNTLDGPIFLCSCVTARTSNGS